MPPPPPRVGVADYVVSSGETLSAIAARFGVGVETIRVANELDQTGSIRSGQRLQVPTTNGSVHLVAPGETLYGIAARYRVELQAVAAANGLDRSLQIRAGQRLVIPGEPRPPSLAARQVTPSPTATPPPTVTPRKTTTPTPTRTATPRPRRPGS
jgi:spore germination protein